MNLQDRINSDIEKAHSLLNYDVADENVELNATLFMKAHNKLGLPYKEAYVYSITLLVEDIIDFKRINNI